MSTPRRGATLTEIGLVLVLIIITAIAALGAVSGALNETFSEVASTTSGGGGGGGGGPTPTPTPAANDPAQYLWGFESLDNLTIGDDGVNMSVLGSPVQRIPAVITGFYPGEFGMSLWLVSSDESWVTVVADYTGAATIPCSTIADGSWYLVLNQTYAPVGAEGTYNGMPNAAIKIPSCVSGSIGPAQYADFISFDQQVIGSDLSGTINANIHELTDGQWDFSVWSGGEDELIALTDGSESFVLSCAAVNTPQGGQPGYIQMSFSGPGPVWGTYMLFVPAAATDCS